MVFLVFGAVTNYDAKFPFSAFKVLLFSSPIYRSFLYNQVEKMLLAVDTNIPLFERSSLSSSLVGVEGFVFGQELKYNLPYMRSREELFDSGELRSRTEESEDS